VVLESVEIVLVSESISTDSVETSVADVSVIAPISSNTFVELSIMVTKSKTVVSRVLKTLSVANDVVETTRVVVTNTSVVVIATKLFVN
jgi:hypothetical protein